MINAEGSVSSVLHAQVGANFAIILSTWSGENDQVDAKASWPTSVEIWKVEIEGMARGKTIWLVLL